MGHFSGHFLGHQRKPNIITKKVLSAIHYPYKEVSLETIKPWKTMKALSNVKKESLQIKMTSRQFFSIITTLSWWTPATLLSANPLMNSLLLTSLWPPHLHSHPALHPGHTPVSFLSLYPNNPPAPFILSVTPLLSPLSSLPSPSPQHQRLESDSDEPCGEEEGRDGPVSAQPCRQVTLITMHGYWPALASPRCPFVCLSVPTYLPS